MSLDTKILLGIASTVLTLVTFAPYLVDTVKGKTKPHLYTWVIWSIVTGIGFFGSFKTGGDAGSWHIGCTFLLTVLVTVFAFYRGTRNIRKFDTYCLLFSFIAIALWIITDNPYWSVIIAVIIDLLAYLPTFRKSYSDPYSETLSLYYLGATKNLLGIFANTRFSVTTCLYPLAIAVANIIFIAFVNTRKRVVSR